MLTHFEIPEDSKEFYFKLNSSFQIVKFDEASPNYKFAGIYAIYKDDVCYYVGQSQNLANRLTQHLTGKYETADRVDCFLVIDNGFYDFFERSKETRKLILENNELLFMSKLKPIENLITPGSDFELDEDKSFSCLSDDDEFYAIGFLRIYKTKYAIDVTSGIGPHELCTDAYKDHNNWILWENSKGDNNGQS